MKKQLHSHPRKFGKDSRGCRVTGACQGLIRKYGINMSRRTFREQADLIGFTKYRWTTMGSKALSLKSYSRDLIDRMNETKIKDMPSRCCDVAVLYLTCASSSQQSFATHLVVRDCTCIIHCKYFPLFTKPFFYFII